MSFMSAACQTCRSRHLKCDEGQPVCQRCTKSRRTCYRAGAVIHIENAFASREKKRPRGPRSRPAKEQPPPSPQSLLVKAPSLDVTTIAFMYYLQRHLLPVGDLPAILKGQSDDAVQLLMTKAENPLLDLSIRTMALAVFSGVHGHQQAAMEASSQYQNLLRTARVNLASIDGTNIDIALLAIFFMGRYEDSVNLPGKLEEGQTFGSALKSIPHHEGAIALLKIWAEKFSSSQAPSEVIKHSRQGMIRSALMRNRPIPKWMADGARFGERDLALQYDRIMVRLVNVRYQVSLLQQSSTVSNTYDASRKKRACELDDELCEIEKSISTWLQSFPNAWRPQNHELNHNLGNGVSSALSEIHVNPMFAAIENRGHAARMLTNSTRIDILRLGKDMKDLQIDKIYQSSQRNIEDTADNLSTNMLCILKGVATTDHPNIGYPVQAIAHSSQEPEPYLAAMAVWPLSVASSTRHLEEGRKQSFRAKLQVIGNLLGNRVFQSVTSGQWLEL